MGTDQVTPRKRKEVAENDVEGARKGRGRGPPTPNPPLAPFPTPPSSRHREKVSQPDFLLPSGERSTSPSTSGKSASVTSLPPHLQTLLTLHHAFNVALSLHIAINPPVLPPHSPSAKKVSLPNLTNFLAIKETVERTSGRRFGPAELGRLAWIWKWDGEKLIEDKTVSQRKKDEEEANPFLVPSDKPICDTLELEGLSYIITPTRTLDPLSGRRVYTHGIGIQLELKPGETRQILHGGGEGGLGNKGQGGGMGAIGRWNVGGEAREDIVKERLEKWVELNGGWEPPSKPALPTPSSSTESTRSTIPPIPMLPLPHLPSSTLLPAANLFAAMTSASPGLSSMPKAPATSGGPSTAGLSDPFVLEEKETKGKVVRPGSVEERRQAMMDRIKARSSSSKQPLATLGSAVVGQKKLPMSTAEQQEELKRRSTLSRLEGVAEGVWMMFSAQSPGPSSLPTPPRGRRKAIPLSEAAEVIVKSSKTPISTAEAQTSLQMLTKLCPFFLTIKTVARQDWIEMPAAVACQPSPGTLPALASISTSSPKAGPPASPTRSPRVALAGPASPGRVRRVGGLREVRERIRRELEG